MKKIRADKLLANLGYGSRREVGIALKAGTFIAGGQPVTDPAQALPNDAGFLASATYRGETLDPIAPLTLLLNKPRGYTCSHDEQGKLVYDLLPERWARRNPPLSSAGRLDKDSTGLVIITDDGDFLHRVISPKHNVWKQYRVTLRDDLKGGESETFKSGTMMLNSDKVALKPAHWVADGPKSGFMSLQEGRYHQIRRMFAALGNHVEELHRFRIGNLELDKIEPGRYRVLNDDDLQKIFIS